LRSLDLDALSTRSRRCGPIFRIVDSPDPEINDRPDAEQFLPSGISEMTAGFRRHHPVQHVAAAFAEACAALEPREAGFEFGNPVLGRGQVSAREAG
jgi:hypothetical protein